MTTVIDDDLWAAVGDPTRRRVFDLILTHGMATATTLSERLPVTRQAVTKHLSVLDKAGLVHATTNGREKQYRANAEHWQPSAGACPGPRWALPTGSRDRTAQSACSTCSRGAASSSCTAPSSTRAPATGPSTDVSAAR
ncbi:putative transcriptional regulator, ArsR [Mycobacteroides abscessus subsp. abscessus]|nr:putative transcriptional regulator, ArsR [Mycobacteroides abscessus subsp. abscessus]